jgi:hypothetical protein
MPTTEFRAAGRRARLGAAVLAALVALLSGLAAGCARRSEARAALAPTPVAEPSVTKAAPARASDAGYDLRPSEQAAVDAFLRDHPDLRVARDADHRASDDDGVAGLYGVYHPYFVRGDDNDDGILDFVLAFVRRDSDRDTPWFSVAVFLGKADGRFAPGAFLEREISLADGDLTVDRDAIIVTPDVAEDAARRYRWDAGKQRHVYVRDEDEDSASPPASQI